MTLPLTAIVTGAARGIGRSIGLRLVQDGHHVAINGVRSSTAKIDEFVNELNSTDVKGRSPVEKSGAPAIRAIAIPGDVTLQSDVAAMISKTVSILGPLYLMVANAGKAPVKPLLSSTADDITDVFSCKFKGAFNCYTEAARQMIAQGDPEKIFGRQKYMIVGASSIAGFRAFAALGLYSAGKFAVRGLTQAMAMELASHNISVNAYAPGIVGTSMWDEVDRMLGHIEGRAPGETLKYCSKSIALGRTSVPEDVAGLVVAFSQAKIQTT
ncbi:hypothetical protein BDV11DRAFT_165740 [Aspergillus similis]